MSNVTIATTQNVNILFESASALHRAGAWLLDVFFLILFLIGIGMATSLLPSEGSGRVLLYVFMYGVPAFIILYPLIFETILNGQTLGKRIVGLRVVCIDGSRPSIGAYVMRWLLGLFELLIASGSIAFMVVLISRNNQRLGDMVAGTTVVRVKKPVSLAELALYVHDDINEIPYPEARNLTDTDAQVLRDVLRMQQGGVSNKVSTQALYATVEGLEHKLGVTNNKPPELFVQDVLTSYGRIHGR